MVVAGIGAQKGHLFSIFFSVVKKLNSSGGTVLRLIQICLICAFFIELVRIGSSQALYSSYVGLRLMTNTGATVVPKRANAASMNVNVDFVSIFWPPIIHAETTGRKRTFRVK